MIDDCPLKGVFLFKHQVYVHGDKSQRELQSLGRFGSDLETTKQRYITQTGGVDHRAPASILDSTEKKDAVTILTLHEALFLNQALGCLAIRDSKSTVLDVQTCWDQFSQINRKFAIEYAVYFYFRTRGWIVKEGSIYGAAFLLYKDGPAMDHARYAVVIYENQTWQSLLTHYRVSQSVKKELLLVHIKSKDELCLRNLKNSTITTKVFSQVSASENFMLKTLEEFNSLDDWEHLK